jgi:wyosine [tRNA(Phe)-imidazoG37] synthetase (radical SAM superfamily)
MANLENRIAFGPVPSRRLGRSLGINNIPPKSCSYSCVYCQVGPTRERRIEPGAFGSPGNLVSAVEQRVETLRAREETLDFLTFVPEGEPTLDVHLAEEIRELKSLGIRLAVLTNGSLVGRENVRKALRLADCVSVKVDAVDEDVWRRINRPSPALRLSVILDGLLRFARTYEGVLITETMLLGGLNDSDESSESTLEFLERLGPRIAYLAVPTRPTLEESARPASEEFVNRAYQRFAERLPHVELLTGSEGTDFGTTGDVVEDLLGVTAVHPLREDAATALLARGGGSPGLLDRLVREGWIEEVRYRGQKFYLRRFPGAA